MSYTLRVACVSSGSLTFEGETYHIENNTLTVDSEATATALSEAYSRVELVSVDDSPSEELPADYPTNEDGEPLCVGKDDGQCSRTVDEPNGVCWQHPTDE